MLLSPDGTWLVYLTPDATVVRNLVTGTVRRVRPHLKPTTWSANSRWLLSGISYGGDFLVLDTATGVQWVHERPPPPSGGSAAPIVSVPPGPYYPCAVTNDGHVVRYSRPDIADKNRRFELDVVDPATMSVRRTITARLDTAAGHVTPLWQMPALLVLGDRAYVISAWREAIAHLPVSLSGGQIQTSRPVAVVGPGPHPSSGANLDGAGAWTAVAALPDQGLVYRVPGSNGDDVVAIDPAKGTSHLLSHTREGWPIAMATLTPATGAS